jgi:hypothetical protein
VSSAAWLAAVAVLTAGCGGGDSSAVLAVEEAVNHRGDAEVTGFLHAEGERVRLCAAVLESFPPQCGEPSLRVDGLDLAGVDGLTREGDVAWKEGVTVVGTIDDGVLTAHHVT